MKSSSLVGHKQILFLQGVQVLQSSTDILQNCITLLLVAIEIISGLPAGKADILSVPTHTDKIVEKKNNLIIFIVIRKELSTELSCSNEERSSKV